MYRKEIKMYKVDVKYFKEMKIRKTLKSNIL